jgi:toxin ParE1/3/4
VNVEAMFERLSRMPGIGTRYNPDDPIYADLRSFPVPGFRKYLIFYRPVDDGVLVFRVVHGARDIHSILAEEFDVEDSGEDDD